MRIRRQGEFCWLVDQIDLADPTALAAALCIHTPPDVEEAVCANDVLAIYSRDPMLRTEQIDAMVRNASGQLNDLPPPRMFTIPICFELGLDWDEILSFSRMARSDAEAAFLGQEFVCRQIGFSPGFPYLGSLPEGLSGIPRRSSPRTRVEPGSVGIARDQCCIYPSATPGGWNLIGWTPLTISNREARFFPIRAGDMIRFRSISIEETAALEGRRLAPD